MGGESRMWRKYSEWRLEADNFDFQKWIHKKNHNYSQEAQRVSHDKYHPWYSNQTANDKAPESVRRSQAYKEWRKNQRQHLRNLTLKSGVLSVKEKAQRKDVLEVEPEVEKLWVLSNEITDFARIKT